MAAAKSNLNPFDQEDAPERKVAPEPDPNVPEISLVDPEEEKKKAAAAAEDYGDEGDEIDGPSRTERKRNRYRENKERAEKAERAADELRAQLATQSTQTAAALEQARQALEFAKGQAQPGKAAPDPIDQAEQNVVNKRLLLYRQYEQRVADPKNPITPTEKAEFERKVVELENEQTDLRFDRRIQQRFPQQQQQRQVDPQVAAMQANIVMRHPELAANQAAQLYADGEWRKLIAGGKPNDYGTMEEALEEADKKFRFGKHKNGAQPKPDTALREKLQGEARGATAATADPPKSIKMTRGLQKLADKAFGHIKDPVQRYEKWAKTVGAQLIKEGVNLEDYPSR